MKIYPFTPPRLDGLTPYLMCLALASALLASLLTTATGVAHLRSRIMTTLDLQVNRLAAPAGAFPIVEQPATGLRFSWRIDCACTGGGGVCCRGQRVESYQLLVREHLPGGDEETNRVDTGRVDAISKGGATSHVLAPLVSLPPDTRFEWSVTVWPGGRHSVGSFQTALRDQADWNGAQWISQFTQARSNFTLKPGTDIASATAYASGVGCYALSVNGQPAADSMMDPGWSTISPMRLLYRAYDVSALLRRGENGIGVRLGFCHYSYIDQAFCKGGHAMRGTCRGFVMCLSVKYMDGTSQRVVTSAADGGAVWLGTTTANPVMFVMHARHIVCRVLTIHYVPYAADISGCWLGQVHAFVPRRGLRRT